MHVALNVHQNQEDATRLLYDFKSLKKKDFLLPRSAGFTLKVIVCVSADLHHRTHIYSACFCSSDLILVVTNY